jgi:hypothetical protein
MAGWREGAVEVRRRGSLALFRARAAEALRRRRRSVPAAVPEERRRAGLGR